MKIMSQLRICHYGDIQIEIRVSGEGSQRLAEFTTVLATQANNVKLGNYDIVVIPGDIMQVALCNGNESKLFAEHLHAIKQYVKRIIIINGNHDIIQRNNGIIENDEKRNLSDSIESIVVAINDPKISYYLHTGLYKDTMFPVTWAVWSQLTKWSALEPKPAYSPWVDNEIPTGALIELFHDPIKGAKDFSGQPSPHFENYSVSLADFRANLIIAADIHAPEIIRFGENNERIFTYCSSLVQRNFGESDYWDGIKKRVSGNQQHGYNEIVFDTATNLPVSCKFHRVHNPISRHTVYIGQEFNYESMTTALSIDATEFNKIRLICQGNLSKFIEHEQSLIEHFRSKYQCTISTDFAKDVIDIQVNESEFDDLTQVIDKDKILTISKQYIEQIVDKTSTITKDDKESAKLLIYQMFEEQMLTSELTTAAYDIKLLEFAASNFMSFSEDVSVRFQNRDITLISGTNGIGKTNMHHFLKWMWCDKITDNQNDRNIKYNRSLLFNDSSELDQVWGQVKMMINGELHVITKTLTRTWKKDSKDIHRSDWIELLKEAPSLKMSIESASFSSDKTDECLSYMSNLMTLRELNRFVFVNSGSLTGLISTKTEDLNAEVLSIIGLDGLNDLIAKWDDLKELKLSQLRKPTETIDEVLGLIDALHTMMETSSDEMLTVAEDIQAHETNIAQYTSSIDLKRSSLHQVPTEQELIEAIQLTHNSIKLTQSTINDHQTVIEQLQSSKAGQSIDTLKTRKHNLELDSVNKFNLISTHDEKATTLVAKRDTAKQFATSVVERVRLQLSAGLQELQTKLSTIDSTREKFEQATTIFMSKYKEVVQELINSEQTEINRQQTVISNAKIQLEKDKSVISAKKSQYDTLKQNWTVLDNKNEELKVSKVCSECGQEIKADAIKRIDLTIVENNDKMLALEKEYKAIFLELETLKSILQSDDEAITHNEQLLSQARSQHSVTSAKLVTFDETVSDDITTKIKTAQAKVIELSGQYVELDKLIKDETLALTANVQRHPETIAALEQITAISSELTTHNESRQVLVDSYDEQQRMIAEAQSAIDQFDALEQSIRTKTSECEAWSKQIEASKIEIDTLTKNIELAKINVECNQEISKLAAERYLIITDMTILIAKKNASDADAKVNQQKMLQYEQCIKDISQWKLIENSLKLYKKLLGKTGLPQYIFAHLVPLINKKLSDTLDGVDFRLMFDQETLELRFIDLKRGVSRPVQFISGMQETIVGLALIHIFRILNNSKRFDILMIDEISGKLNDGKNLSYESKDYKKLVTAFIIKISKGVNVYIIDHVLHFHDARILEVQPTDNGAIIVDITD